MKHRAAPDFWEDYRRLPSEVQRTADCAFELLKADPHHPSIHLKRIDEYWSARVGLHHRALAVRISDGLLWFWIGTRAEYDDIVGYSLLPMVAMSLSKLHRSTLKTYRSRPVFHKGSFMQRDLRDRGLRLGVSPLGSQTCNH